MFLLIHQTNIYYTDYARHRARHWVWAGKGYKDEQDLDLPPKSLLVVGEGNLCILEELQRQVVWAMP